MLKVSARIESLPRVKRDIVRLTRFLSTIPRSNPGARQREILNAILDIADAPMYHPVGFKRPSTGIELRRWNVRQFAIIYSYDPPTSFDPGGVVWIRAVRHSRARNVYAWVREQVQQLYTPRFSGLA